MDDYPLHMARRDKIWSKREPWNKIYRDAYEFAIPHRRPGGDGTNKNPVDRLFDMTATTSVMYFAGSLQRDLFPAGQQPFTLQSGALAKQKLGAGASKLDRELEKIAAGMYPFFLTGEWDMAVHEACIDLGVGTGAILPVKGDSQQPVMFVAIPFDEIAIGEDGFRRVNFVSWKQRMERQAIRDAFPNGTFPEDFNAKDKATEEVTIYQDFVKRTGGNQYGWDFRVSIDNHPGFVTSSWSKSQPIAVPRYYRVPGEAYGRGPVLLALPSIKTLNKAQELALKAAAIQMLGIWAYRSGGTFNPDTVRVGPGEFWPMQSTGGILGPDVSRIDPASGRMDVARMVIGNLQADVKQALYDVRIPEYEGTPRSASEIAGRLRQKAETHIGAFGRLTNEIMPVIAPRVAEILYEMGFLDAPLNIDQFLIATAVQSPMAAALNGERLASIATYVEMVGQLAGPDKVPLYVHMDKVLGRIGEGLHIDKSLIPDDDERKAIGDDLAEQQMQAMAAQAVQTAAPNVIEGALAA
ncbi:portal protein [Aureimonas sp. AU12]|uniref:portal protein n=1 Tax=Aureimonas sp. AU12 TaxID=1638161 RepID=UPI0007861E66|nr:portal protein [Aureimonas sp. AU12]